MLQGIEITKAIVIAEFLCTNEPNELIKELKPEWVDRCNWSFEKKCESLALDPPTVYPFADMLSGKIDVNAFCTSMLLQPDLFIRIRPEQRESVTRKLEQAGIPFKQEGRDCLRLANNSKLDELLAFDKEIVVQDLNSQRIGDVLKEIDDHGIKKVWDCCAASGGKSILTWDILGPFDLTVSDIRKNILANLEKRFATAGITVFKRFQADLSSPDFKTGREAYDLVIADLPCSGSGTWARTPEQLHFFKTGKLREYQRLQQKIILNSWPAVKPGGYYLYITCSVFEMENESQLEFIQQQFPATLIRSEFLEGYTKKADTLFFALLQKPL